MLVEDKLNIMHWNAQSITNLAKKIELQHFLNSKNIDVLLLNETFLKPEHNFKILGYNIYRSDRPSNGGGVAIAIKNNLKHSLIKSIPTSNIENIGIELKINRQKIFLIAVYSPRYDSNFKKELKNITQKYKEFLIFGDLNAKHRSWNCLKGNTAGNVLFNMQVTSNFFIHFPGSPTRYPQGNSAAKPSTIDLLLTNSTIDISYLTAHEHQLPSDHAPVTCTISGTLTRFSKLQTDYSKADWVKYKNDITNYINSTSINNLPITLQNIDIILNKFINFIQTANANIPKVQCQAQVLKLSTTTKICINRRNLYRRKIQRSGNPIEKAICLIQFITALIN